VNVAVKLTAAFLAIIATGPPILKTWEALWLAALAFMLIFGTRRSGRWRLAVAIGIAISVLAAKGVLPRADIAEGHNAFLVIGQGEPIERGLPPEIFRSWKARFDALYPPDPEPYEARSEWRKHGVPTTLFVQSADAIWRPAKYTRQVDEVAFQSLAEFRAGFANDQRFPWWEGELRRETMPFFVMYELSPASVGSRLSWTGQLFWERGDGTFDEIVHQQTASREVGQADVGKRVYAAFFHTPGMLLTREGEFDFRLEPSLMLRLSGYVENMLTVTGGLAIVLLVAAPRWMTAGRALSIFAAAYGILTAFMWASLGKYLGSTYPPHGGGDDGLVHDGWGHMMAIMAGSGRVVEALKGDEPVYWFTPGFRYFRMVEKLIFGDTNLLYAVLVSCIPVAVFYLLRHFLAARWAAAITAVSCLMPVGNLSFVQYLANAKLGYGEALAIGMMLVGLTLLLRTQPAWGGVVDGRATVWVAGVALAGAMFIRPNFSLVVAFLGIAHAWGSWRRGDRVAIAALVAGLGLALWMPFHNIFYGGEFFLISRSGATVSVPLGPGDYLAALQDLVRGELGSRAVEATSAQLQGWLWTRRFLLVQRLAVPALAAQVVNIIALVVTWCVALRWVMGRGLRGGPAVGIVAMCAVLGHVPMFFIFDPHYRFSMLGWDLALVVTLVTLLRRYPAVSSAAAAPAQV
jgi:hypothetical protein